MDNKKSFAKINLQRIYILYIRQYFSISCLNSNNFWICRIPTLPRVVNIIRDVKDSRNTAYGHGSCCSVRLNGPIWWFILTHRYRLSLSQFTEAVMIESATGATFAAQKQESPDAKVSCPSGCCRIIKAYLYCQSSIILLSSWKISNFKLCQSRKMQWIHKVEGMTYTLNRYIDVPRFLTNLSHEKMKIVKLFMWLHEFSSVRHINIARACL